MENKQNYFEIQDVNHKRLKDFTEVIIDWIMYLWYLVGLLKRHSINYYGMNEQNYKVLLES